VAAARAATITAALVVLGGEDEQAAFHIKISGLRLGRGFCWIFPVEVRDAIAAKTRLVFLLFGNLVEEGLGDVNLGAPARPFEWVRPAELTVVGLSTEGTFGGVNRG
jgi:hypothetical protein